MAAARGCCLLCVSPLCRQQTGGLIQQSPRVKLVTKDKRAADQHQSSQHFNLVGLYAREENASSPRSSILASRPFAMEERSDIQPAKKWARAPAKYKLAVNRVRDY